MSSRPHQKETRFQLDETVSSASKVVVATEGTLLLPDGERLPSQLVRRDSEFTVGTQYADGSPNDLLMWQGAALLTADCLGTGLLALPADIHVLGVGFGLAFLIANLPINLFAGTIFHKAATAVEKRQEVENELYRVSQPSMDRLETSLSDDGEDETPEAYGALDRNDSQQHSQAHHDTATFDFIGMTQALFQEKSATRVVMAVFYVNIFLVLGNYILVMSHAVQAVIGEDRICLPTAGLVASSLIFLVGQSRTMARLGRAASVVSLSALFVVVMQCLWEVQQLRKQTPWDAPQNDDADGDDESSSLFRKFSALGSIGFAVGSQKLFLNIRHELRYRGDAPASLAVALTAFGAFYVGICLAAGPNPPSFLFDAIPLGSFNRRIAGLLMWIHVVVSYAINSQAICSSMDRLVWHRLLRITEGCMALPGPGSDDAPKRWMVLTGLMATTAYLVANAVPFFKDLVALIGSMTSVPLTLLLPAVFWRKEQGVPLLFPMRGSQWSFALTWFSILFMVVATVGTLYSIDIDWSQHGPPFSCN